MLPRRSGPAVVAACAAFVCGLAAAPVHAQVEPGRDWPVLQDRNLETVAGSALDFSELMPGAPIGDKDTISIAGESFRAGNTALGPQHCATPLFSTATGGFPNHAEADRVAAEMKRRGYNLARFHYVDATLMNRRKGDFDFDPEQLDRLFYLLAALKKQGVRWIVDGMTSTNGAMGDVGPHRYVWKYNLRLDVHWNPATREHWRELMKRLWARPNPYTGRSTLADPALVGVLLVNENNIRFLQQRGDPYPPLTQQFEQWLARKGGEDAGLRGRWAAPMAARANLGGALGERLRRPGTDPMARDVDSFLTELETDTAAWMRATLAELGYRGPSTAYHTVTGAQANATRAQLPWVDFHTYHDHQNGWPAPGANIRNVSSLDSGLEYVRQAVSARIPGKPFTVTEYGDGFWNSYRHEGAVTLPVVAARQRWAGICRFSENSVVLAYGSGNDREKLIGPVSTGIDPIVRAGEALAALLYRRGDVLSAKSLPRPLARITGDPESSGTGFEIVSDRTELAIVRAGGSARLPTVEIAEASTRALVAVSDIENAATLGASRRLLVTVMTDALNGGMRFEDESRRTMRTPGALPARIEPVQFTLRLKGSGLQNAKAWALSLDGKRQTELPLTRAGNDQAVLKIDTAAAPTGPYLFVEVNAR